MHFRFAAQSSRSTSVIFNNPKVCTRPEVAIGTTANLHHSGRAKTKQ
jgi:hypothetical protein